MPRGRSTFNKRQKEQARQQKQKDKALRRSERKQNKSDFPGNEAANEMDELQKHAEDQAALFRIGNDEYEEADGQSDPRN